MTAAQPPLLERLVGDVDAFAVEHWGTRPMLRHTSERFTDWLSVEDVEDCLDGALRQPAFRLVRDGETLPAEAVTKRLRLGGRDIEGVADPERIAAEFAAGASIVLQGLDRFWPNAVEMAKTLESQLGHPLQLNAYLSPADAKALDEHTDDHDVLVLQVEGTKRWWVDGLGEFEMEPGAVVYIPRSTRHRAQTNAAASLHLTVGIFPVSIRKAVHQTLQELDDDERPLAPLMAQHTVESQMAAALKEAAEHLLARDPATAARMVGARAVGWRRSILKGQLRDIVDLPGLDATRRIRLRHGVTLHHAEDGVRLRIKGGGLHVPTVGVAAVDAIAEHDGIRIADLPGLDANSRLVLARRLVKERLAEVLPDD